MAMLSGKSRELSRRVWRVAGLLTVSSNYLAGGIIIVAVDAGTEFNGRFNERQMDLSLLTCTGRG
jgi:hypothetical protein